MKTNDAWVRALAPCKVNPHLEVLSRRADGFHELDMTMLALDRCDEVSVRATEVPRVTLRVSGPHASADIPSDERNLAYAAAHAVWSIARDERRIPSELGLEIELVKHLPSQAGLGAGSSDAAAAMAATEALFDIDLGERGDLELAQLGSDCVFFRRASATGFARCTGRGERVEPLPAPTGDLFAVVLIPACGAATPQVYAHLARRLSPDVSARSLPPHARRPDAPLAGAHLFNRLEEAALAALPELRPWRELLDSHFPLAFRLAGSGSSFFGLWPGPSAAHGVRDAVAQACRRAGLAPRGLWCARAGQGARVVE